MKTAILILFLAMSLSFKTPEVAYKVKHIPVSDRLDKYRLRDNHNLNEFDKKVNILLTNKDE